MRTHPQEDHREGLRSLRTVTLVVRQGKLLQVLLKVIKVMRLQLPRDQVAYTRIDCA